MALRQGIAMQTLMTSEQEIENEYLPPGAFVEPSPPPSRTTESDTAADAPEVTHLEIPLSHFADILLRDKSDLPDLDDVAAALISNADFQQAVQYYARCEQGETDADEGVMDLLSKILRMIVNSYPKIDTRPIRPFDLRFVRDYQFADRPKPHHPPQLIGAFAPPDPFVDYGWDAAALLIGYGCEFEVAADAFAAHQRHPSGASPSSTTACNMRSSLPCLSDNSTSGGVRLTPPPEMTRCAREVFSALGNRRHILGISIYGRAARFRYFDRAGTIRTPAFDPAEDQFVKGLIRLAFASLSQLGLEESFVAPPRTAVSPWKMFSEVRGCTIQVEGTPFVLRGKLYSSSELHGRGTSVYAATCLDISESSQALPDEVVVKLSWQLASAHREDAFYRLAAERGVEGIAHLHRSECITRLSQGFRGRLVHSSQYRDRELRAQVLGPLAIPLYRVKDFETFTTAFKSLVKGEHPAAFLITTISNVSSSAHRDLYAKAGILHNDISVNNLMVDAKDHSVGVLIDLDLAVSLKDGDRKLPVESAAGGTLPFRAVHMLYQGSTITELHYRYDLESFFYSLVWILAYHPLDSSTEDFTRWSRGPNLRSIGYLKRAQLTDMRLGDGLPPGPLKQRWLQKLAALFDIGINSYERAWGEGDRETCDGRITFNTFMSVLES